MTPWQFCLDAKDHGYQVILIRRPGFGRSSACQAYTDQKQIVTEALNELELEDIHLHATGSAGYLGWQLLKDNDRIERATFCNYAFGPVTNFEFQRVSENVRLTVRQAVTSELGCKMLLIGMRTLLNSGKKRDYIEKFFEKSAADLAFLKYHEAELWESFDTITKLSAKTLRNDIRQLTVLAEPDSSFKTQKPFQLLLGGDAHETFRNVANKRAEKLGGKTLKSKKHDYFVGFTNFFEFAKID